MCTPWQILVLPTYQRKGYGRFLLEALNEIAVSEDVYDLTIEEPLDYLQRLRTCIDIPRLLASESVQKAVDVAVSYLKEGKLSKKTQVPRLMPPQSVIDEVRKALKINKKQFLLCWEVLIYLGLDPADKYIEDFVAIVSHHMKEDILGKDSDTAGKQVIQVPTEYDEDMSFVMSRFASGEAEKNVPTVDENQANQAEQLQKLVDERVKEIKLVAEKVNPNCV